MFSSHLKRSGLSAFAVATISLVASAARGQGNYKSAALGGRSALMGDTGVALGTDGAAPFLNPATVTRVESALALSVNFISLDFTRAKNWYVPGVIDTATYGNIPQSGADINRLSGNAIPSTFCIFQHLPRTNHHTEGRQGVHKFAHCFGTTEVNQFDWSGRGYQAVSPDRSVIQASSARRSWQRFVIAPTYAINVTENISVGGAVQLAINNFGFLNSVGTITAGSTLPTTSTAYQSAMSGSSFSLDGIVGATVTEERWTLGATVQTPDFAFAGSGNTSSYIQFASAATTSSTAYVGSGKFRVHEPTRFGTGVGYKWPNGTTIEVDASFALASGNALDLEAQGTALDATGKASAAADLHLHTRYRPTLNAGAGADVYFTPRFSVMTGFATDFSAVDQLGADSLAMSKVDRVLASVGFGSHSPEGGMLLLGLQGYYGWGSALAPNVYSTPPTLAATNVQTYGVLFVIGGTANAKAIEQAVNAVEKAVDPHARPIHIPDPETAQKKEHEEKVKEDEKDKGEPKF